MKNHNFHRFVAQSIPTTVSIGMMLAVLVRAEEPPSPPKPITYVDLQSKANQKLSDSLHGFQGNDFSEFPKGEEIFGGVRFKIEEGYIRLGGGVDIEQPKKVMAIPLNKAFATLHILHGTGYGAYGGPGGPLFIADDTVIGEYRVNYEDGSTESIPIVYGQDVRDWWNWGKPADVSAGQIAWTGKNGLARQLNQDIHVYLATWSNPHPEKKVATLDYICTGKSAASPFCVAMSIEEK